VERTLKQLRQSHIEDALQIERVVDNCSENAFLEEGYSSVTVPMITLDELCSRPVGFVKIDVEGHELEVLRVRNACWAETTQRCL